MYALRFTHSFVRVWMLITGECDDINETRSFISFFNVITPLHVYLMLRSEAFVWQEKQHKNRYLISAFLCPAVQCSVSVRFKWFVIFASENERKNKEMSYNFHSYEVVRIKYHDYEEYDTVSK